MPTPNTTGPAPTVVLKLARWEFQGKSSWTGALPIADDKMVLVKDDTALGCIMQLGRFEPTLVEDSFLFGGPN